MARNLTMVILGMLASSQLMPACANVDLGGERSAAAPSVAVSVAAEEAGWRIDARDLLRYFRFVRAMASDEFRVEYERVLGEVQREGHWASILKLGLLQVAAGPGGDDPKVISLLEAYLAEQVADGTSGDLALLLMAVLQERKEQQAAFEREQHEHQLRARNLEQKLEALKSIERSIQERGTSAEQQLPADDPQRN